MARVKKLSCKPLNGYRHCVGVEVNIAQRVEVVFDLATHIQKMHRFFPDYVFESACERFAKDCIYSVSERGRRNKATYKIVEFVPNRYYSGEMISGGSIFQKFRYQHYFIGNGNQTISREFVHYSLKYGMLGTLLEPIAEAIITKRLRYAHARLKDVSEKR